jgi:uncharacterized FAD-dependent dehydrogenase
LEAASISFWAWGNANECFPEGCSTEIRAAVSYLVSQFIGNKDYPKVSVFAPEMDYYWKVFSLKRGFQSARPGVYLVGDCSGHFRGILQAFCSGLNCVDYISGELDVHQALYS